MFAPALPCLLFTSLLPILALAHDAIPTEGTAGFERRSLSRRRDDQLTKDTSHDRIVGQGYNPAPDPNADYTTWFPADQHEALNILASSHGSKTDKRHASQRRDVITSQPEQLNLSTGDTDWTVQFSDCASTGERKLASSWICANGTKVNSITWYQIYMDAMNAFKQHKFATFDEALDDGTTRNLQALSERLAAKKVTLGTATVANHAAINRRMMPNGRTMAFLCIASVLTEGMSAAFSISANKANHVAHVTWGNFQSGSSSLVLLWITALLAWVISPKFRSTVNRLTASGATAVVVEQATRVVHVVNGDEYDASETTAGDDAGDPAPETISVISSGFSDATTLPKTPLTNFQLVSQWLDRSTAALDSTSTSSDYASAMADLENQNANKCPV